MMVGVRQFDEEVVLDRVMDAFWRHGSEATTMADLARAAGVQRGSLYNAYGDREALLTLALERYAAQQGAGLREALADPDPRAAMEGFLAAHLARMEDPGNPTGCLMAQTAMARHDDPEVAPRVREAFERTEAALRETLAGAQARGALPADADVGALARFFLGVSRGMAVLHRAYGDTAAARDMARAAMAVLPS